MKSRSQEARADRPDLCTTLPLVGSVPADPYVTPYEDSLPIHRCEGLTRPLAELRPATGNFR